MEHKLEKIEKLTNEKYLNLYKAIYKNKNEEITYLIASRKQSINDIRINNKSNICDAVRGLPYFHKDNKLFVVFIKQFRYTINEYVYECPAGMVDENETEQQAIKREMLEEIGAEIINLTQTEKASFSSVGLTDETFSNFEAEIKFVEKPNLMGGEDIEIEIIPFENIPEFIDSHNLDVTTALQYKNFYYKKLLESK